MRPAVVLLGFVLGSAAAITFALVGVAVVFGVLRPEHPRLSAELWPLLTGLGEFAVLTGLAAASFYGCLHERRWRKPVVSGLLLWLGVVGWLHWPS